MNIPSPLISGDIQGKTTDNPIAVTGHPCMDASSHNLVARLHLPVASRCNIMCRYCERRVCPANIHEVTPGLTTIIMTPEQALEKTAEFLDRWGSDSIIGVAGPGDPLACEETFITMKLIRNKFPLARMCMCTNGLELPAKMNRIISLGIDYITVTLNALDPETGALIYRWIRVNDETIHGIGGATVLIENQIEGIRRAVKAGIFVKINTVLVPGINDRCVADISRLGAEMGCRVHNIVPLIPRGEFIDISKPGPEFMEEIRRISGSFINVFGSCRQCRADAAGIPGKERCCEKI